MVKGLQLSRVETILVMVLLLGAIGAFAMNRMNGEAAREKTSVEARLRTAGVNLSTLEQLVSNQQKPVGRTLPNKAAALAVTNQFLQNARSANIAITSWDFGDATVTVNTRTYEAIKHTVQAQGTMEALTDFVRALYHDSVVPAVKKMDITKVEGKEDIWRARLELMVYYGES